MANPRAAAVILLIMSLFMVVAISRAAAAKPTEGPNKTTALHHDAHGQDAASPEMSEPKPTCDDDKCEPEPEPPTCDDHCEEPKPEPKPEPEPEPKSELTCNKVHGVQEGETCYCLAQGVGLTLDNFLSFNPNICCDNLFIGQWVCLDATSGC
ncbi:hypothetical protein SORBI_3003G318100 [Sorghum bicolor]|uniref:LysM domain-containing protein n=1 Tax=Sorghum bicolor TaxID=4558 RepID=A0A1W0VZW3_SORBI|nr:hypothetical protein SORBI_3003G318100 [Sorghum bicolor]